MYNEFHNKIFPGASGTVFQTGNDVLTFYEIEDINRTHDMITLLGYAMFIHLASLVVLYVRYYVIRGRLKPVDSHLDLSTLQNDSFHSPSSTSIPNDEASIDLDEIEL